MRLSVKFLVIASILTAALGAFAATPAPPTPDAPKPCICPYKSPTACAIYCGIF